MKIDLNLDELIVGLKSSALSCNADLELDYEDYYIREISLLDSKIQVLQFLGIDCELVQSNNGYITAFMINGERIEVYDNET